MTRSVLVAGVLATCAAHAELKFGESPQNFMIEVKAGPFMPLVDRAFEKGRGPFGKVFGNAPLIMGELELDFQVFQKFGSASIGISGGYAEKFGDSLNPDTLEKVPGSSTGIRFFPIKLLGIYRFDYWALHRSIPLVPYAKLGLVAMPFAVVNDGVIETPKTGSRGAGVKFGYAGVLGLSLLLDVLDQRLSRDFDNSMGVNHSYLFAEFALQEVNNFRATKTGDLDLSSRHFMFGLGFEF